jgi:hypothetical protein
VHDADPPDRLVQRGTQRRVAGGERLVQRRLRNGEVLEVDPVEAAGDLADRLRAAQPDVLADGAHDGQHRVDVGGGARQQGGELARPG